MPAQQPLKLRRRQFLGVLAAGGVAWMGRGLWAAEKAAPPPEGKPLFTFGVVTDVQYQDLPPQGKRAYKDSPAKLEACVKDFNARKPEFVIHLGDFINGGGMGTYDAVHPLYEKLTVPHYHVLGNHDFSVDPADKPKVFAKLALDKKGDGKGWYDFARPGWRFIVLNGNAIGLQQNLPGSEAYKAAEAIAADLKQRKAKNASTAAGACGPEQRAWLDKTLAKADAAGEKAIVFCHFPVYLPAGGSTLWDDTEVMKILESHKCVVVFIDGHVHGGAYGQKNGIHYLTLKGMVENPEPTYSLIEVRPKSLQVVGVGAEPARTLAIP